MPLTSEDIELVKKVVRDMIHEIEREEEYKGTPIGRLVALENGIRRLEEGQFQIRQAMLSKESLSPYATKEEIKTLENTLNANFKALEKIVLWGLGILGSLMITIIGIILAKG